MNTKGRISVKHGMEHFYIDHKETGGLINHMIWDLILCQKFWDDKKICSNLVEITVFRLERYHQLLEKLLSTKLSAGEVKSNNFELLISTEQLHYQLQDDMEIIKPIKDFVIKISILLPTNI